MKSLKSIIFIAIIISSTLSVAVRKTNSLIKTKVNNSSKDNNSVNVLVNGDFEQPNVSGGWKILTSIPGWTVSLNAEIGFGLIYNNYWTTEKITELDSNENNVLSQTLTYLLLNNALLNLII